jgi:hypothetical protein
VREGVVQRGLGAGVAVVAVVGGAGDPAGRLVAQDLVRVVGFLVAVVGVRGPVVVVGQDPGAWAGGAELRAERRDDLQLLGYGHVGAGVGVRGAVLGFVLDGQEVDGHTGGGVGLDEPDEVAGVGVVDRRVVLEPAADE